jgi:hypothetical protein
MEKQKAAESTKLKRMCFDSDLEKAFFLGVLCGLWG